MLYELPVVIQNPSILTAGGPDGPGGALGTPSSLLRFLSPCSASLPFPCSPCSPSSCSPFPCSPSAFSPCSPSARSPFPCSLTLLPSARCPSLAPLPLAPSSCAPLSLAPLPLAFPFPCFLSSCSPSPCFPLPCSLPLAFLPLLPQVVLPVLLFSSPSPGLPSYAPGLSAVLLALLLCSWALLLCFWPLLVLLGSTCMESEIQARACFMIRSSIIFGASNHLGETSKHHFRTQDGKMLQNEPGNAWNTLAHHSRRTPAGLAQDSRRTRAPASRGGSLASRGHGAAKES